MPTVSDRIGAFFEFVYRRQEIWHRRFVQQMPRPWTDDEILQTYKFCNVYRELDGGTQAITRYLTGNALSPENKLFNIIAYRFFNRRDTIEHLFGGVLDAQNFNLKHYEKRLDALKQEETIFSNAYLISSHPFDASYRPKDKHVQVLLMLEALRGKLSGIVSDLRRSTPQEGLKVIENAVALAGPFLSGQILLDATYAKDVVPYTGDDFLIVGPGAHWGLNIIFGEKLSAKEADAKCRKLYAMQAAEFAKLKAQGADWERIRWQNPDYPNAPYLCLHDIQNSLCEFRKYWRLKNGEKAKKRYFA